jgi:selenocysteine lyase/cysteine desulfurase
MPLSAPTPDALRVLGSDVHVATTTGEKVAYANLDYAATAPCLRAAADAVAELLPSYASVHRGAGALSQLCTRRFEEARESVKDFLGCRGDDTLVFTRNTTDALNLLAHVLPAETTVITFAGEHHANLLPWQYALRLPVPHSAEQAVRDADLALAQLAGRPALLSVTGASNVTGELLPLADLAATAHRHGARIAVDAAQLAPHVAVDVTRLDLDYVALSGHKLYAPFGAGVLAGRGDWLDEAGPYLAGGGASAHVADGFDVRWATGAARHEAGTPNLLGAVALAAVCDALRTADRDALAAEEASLVTRLRAGLAELEGLHELRAFEPGAPRVGIVSFVVDGVASSEVSARLATDWGVGVRDGLFCAHPLTRHLLATAGGHGTGSPATTCGAQTTAVRASVGLGSTEEHIDRLLAGLRAIR